MHTHDITASDQWMHAAAPTLFRSEPTVHIAGQTDGVLGVGIHPGDALDDALGLDWESLKGVNFTGEVGQAFSVIQHGRRTVLFGLGTKENLTSARLRDAAASFARATLTETSLAVRVPKSGPLTPEDTVRLVVEGIALARYRFDSLMATKPVPDLEHLTFLPDGADETAIRKGAKAGLDASMATNLARDLANSPPILLTAQRLATIASEFGPENGLTVTVYDKDQLIDMGCGGLLGVNAGSSEPPRMIKLEYVPDGNPTGRLTLVGKGIMYDAGGIALKPADDVHATMKNDMSGAGSILAAMLSLRDLACPAAVTGYLMCTDNRPSATALAMGDVITIRGGTTVEVVNTDAEGRLVLADALVLATEEPTDAIVDIATLTGAAMRTFGTEVAAVIGSNDDLVTQVRGAADRTDEAVWPLPLEHRYRNQINSPVADLKNLGGANAGSITAALFLHEFVADTPWAHIDIAGTAQNNTDVSWHPPGCTGFGTRLLLDLACTFTPPTKG